MELRARSLIIPARVASPRVSPILQIERGRIEIENFSPESFFIRRRSNESHNSAKFRRANEILVVCDFCLFNEISVCDRIVEGATLIVAVERNRVRRIEDREVAETTRDV